MALFKKQHTTSNVTTGLNARPVVQANRAGGTARSVTVGGVAFDDVTMEDAVARILLCVQKSERPQHVCTGNLDHLVMLQKDGEFRAIYEKAALVLADGMPIIWLSRLAARRDHAVTPLRERVAGSDLFWELGRVSAQNGLRLFFLGGMPGAADRAAKELTARYPGVSICGTYCPPVEAFNTPAEQARIEAVIRKAAPDVLLVGLGAPKQEKWIAEHKTIINVPVCIGVGGSFEMAAGMVKRAPLWAQRYGMEWACRMLQDPRRLVRRYLGRDLPFLFVLLIRTLVARPSGTARKGAVIDFDAPDEIGASASAPASRTGLAPTVTPPAPSSANVRSREAALGTIPPMPPTSHAASVTTATVAAAMPNTDGTAAAAPSAVTTVGAAH